MDLKVVNSLLQLGKETVDLFNKVKGKLINQPVLAEGKLETVFMELSKIFLAFDSEITGFLALSFDKDGDLQGERKQLLKFEGIEIRKRCNDARGHCGKIAHIYDKYLDKWFSKLLTPGEYQEMRLIFGEMEDSDAEMIAAIDTMENWLKSKAEELLDLLDTDQLEKANQKVRDFRKEARPLRQTLLETTDALHRLVNTFSDMSGAV